eukprot:4570933-Lingulodinium_polyedra.AAC.1
MQRDGVVLVFIRVRLVGHSLRASVYRHLISARVVFAREARADGRESSPIARRASRCITASRDAATERHSNSARAAFAQPRGRVPTAGAQHSRTHTKQHSHSHQSACAQSPNSPQPEFQTAIKQYSNSARRVRA